MKVEEWKQVSAGKSRVGIGMPVYNGERYLEESLRATLAQTYNDFRLAIADNASTDRTGEICRDYAVSDPRILYVRNPVNLGAPKNYARCFELAGGEYFRWANADDIPEPTLIAKCVEILDQHADTVLVYSRTKIIDEHGTFIENYDDQLNLPHDRAADRFRACLERIGLNNVMYGLMRRSALSRTKLLGNYVAADINLVAELTLYGKFVEVTECLFSRRIHPEASSWDRKDAERQRKFWNPSRKRLVMRTWRRIYEYNRSVLRAPIPAAQKYTLLYYLAKKAYWSRSSMLSELKDLMRI